MIRGTSLLQVMSGGPRPEYGNTTELYGNPASPAPVQDTHCCLANTDGQEVASLYSCTSRQRVRRFNLPQCRGDAAAGDLRFRATPDDDPGHLPPPQPAGPEHLLMTDSAAVRVRAVVVLPDLPSPQSFKFAPSSHRRLPGFRLVGQRSQRLPLHEASGRLLTAWSQPCEQCRAYRFVTLLRRPCCRCMRRTTCCCEGSRALWRGSRRRQLSQVRTLLESTARLASNRRRLCEACIVPRTTSSPLDRPIASAVCIAPGH